MFILYGGAVSWKNFKQQTIADSITEVKYISASEAAKEAVWMKKFIIKLDVVPGIEQPVPLYCDNTGQLLKPKNQDLIINPSTS